MAVKSSDYHNSQLLGVLRKTNYLSRYNYEYTRIIWRGVYRVEIPVPML
jgi:hypothetical protein